MSDNMVDKDVQSMLLPLNLMQNIMFCPKYRIKNNLISPISIFHSLVSLIGTGLFIFAFFHRLYILYVDRGLSHQYTQYIISFFDCGYYSFGLTMNFISSVFESKTYISFVLIYQNINRFLCDNKRSKNFTFWNWFSVITAGSYFVVIFISFSLIVRLPYYYILSVYSVVSFDFNYIYAIRLLKLLEDKAVLWNTRALDLQEIEDKDEVKRIFDAYVNILKCYKIYEVCFRKIVSIRVSYSYKKKNDLFYYFIVFVFVIVKRIRMI